MTFGLIGAGLATTDDDGLMSAAAYRRFAGEPPTMPTTAPASLALASGTWSEATVTNVAATTGPTVNDLTYARCHSLGHATAGTVMRVVALLPGFGGSGVSEFPASFMRGLADMGFLVLRLTTQGRGTVDGALHYQPFETQAILDLIAAAHTAATSAGATVYGGGRCAWFLSSSTGAIDLGLMLQRCPEAVLGGTILYPNADLLRYHELVSSSTLTSLESQLAVLGAREPAALDYYTATNLDAISRVLALPECTAQIFIGGDEEDISVPIPLPSDIVRTARGEHGSRGKVSYRITTSADNADERIQHNGGATANGVTRFNYGWAPVALAATEWHLPVAFKRLRAQGMIRMAAVTGSASPADDRPGVEIWLSPSVDGRDDANCGRALSADVSVTADGLITIEPVTSTAGFAEVISGTSARVVPLEPRTVVDLSAAPPIVNVPADLVTLGVTHAWFSDTGVTGGGTITAWAEAAGFGAITLAASANHPATASDSDGIPTVRFTAASSTKLMAASLPFSPRESYALIVVFSIPTSAAGQIVNLTHQGTYDTLSLGVTSTPTDIVYYRDNTYNGIAATVGGHAVSTAAKHVSVTRRDGSDLYESLDLGNESHTAIDPAKDTFDTSGTNHMTVGAGLADHGNPAAPFEWKSVDVYAILSAPINLTPAEYAGITAYLRRRFIFGSAPAVRTPVGAPVFEIDMTVHAADFTGRLHTAHQVDLSGSAVTVALPDPATCPGRELLVSQVVAGTENLILTPSAGEIEGASSLTTAGNGSGAGISKRLYSYGAAPIGWKVI